MKKILFYLFFLSTVVSYSQQEASNWYFGENAGINFNTNTGEISALNGGQLFTEEGCTSISDSSGNLLFYTNGINAYNRDHELMPNGTGLKGHQSSTQSAIIIPKPDGEGIYYIFTVDTDFNSDPDEGFHYSEVNMNLDGGLGDITAIKNINLLRNTSEKLSAVLKNCETQSFWIITFANRNGSSETNNTFFAYEVTSNGVNTRPVISDTSLNFNERRGYLKFSPDGTKLASANISAGLYIFDFDANTGLVSNMEEINISFQLSPTHLQSSYGLEFSPDSQLLYVSSYFETPQDDFNNPNAQYGALLQYDLSSLDISNSEIVIDDRQMYRSALQLGPNGKIYRSLSATYNQGTPFLSVINNPNTIGLGCDYQHAAIDLDGNLSRQGLPPFISSFFNANIDIINNGSSSTYLPLCEGETYTLIAENIPGATYEWSFNGQIIAEDDFDLIINQSGIYKVLIDLSEEDCNTFEGVANVEFFQYPEAFNTTLRQCDDDTDGITLFNLDEANNELTGGVENVYTKFYTTLLDAQNDENEIDSAEFINFTNPQVIFAQVINDLSDCNTMAELTLEVSFTTPISYQIDPLCDELDSEDGINTFNLDEIATQILIGLPSDLTVSFYDTYNDALLEQNELNTTYTNTTPYSQTLYTRLENDNLCYNISAIELTVSRLPILEEDENQFYCLNLYPETITINAGILNDDVNNYTYSWTSGQDTNEIQINEIGTYSVTATNIYGCSSERTITIEASNIATFDNVEIIDGYQNNTVTIFVSGEGTYIYSIHNNDGMHTPFQSSNIFNNIPSGIYTVEVKDIKNDCGIVENLVSVIGFPLFFTPNNDGYNDTWIVKGLSSQFQPDSKILIFDRFGKLLKQLDPLGEGWDGTFKGEPLPNSDYWFSVTLQDGRNFINHFTLKR